MALSCRGTFHRVVVGLTRPHEQQKIPRWYIVYPGRSGVAVCLRVRSGSEVEWWAHNPQVAGSKPASEKTPFACLRKPLLLVSAPLICFLPCRLGYYPYIKLPKASQKTFSLVILPYSVRLRVGPHYSAMQMQEYDRCLLMHCTSVALHLSIILHGSLQRRVILDQDSQCPRGCLNWHSPCRLRSQ